MPDNFQQTVNLKEKMEKMKQEMTAPKQPLKPKVQPSATTTAAASRAEDIDRLYRDNGNSLEKKEDLKKFNRPVQASPKKPIFKNIVFFLAIAVVAGSLYFVFKQEKQMAPSDQAAQSQSKWYRVKLVNGEVYYGRIVDIKADPIEISSVYYNYNQLQANEPEGDKAEETGNLRLVKRGKETYGPEGTMNIVRSQVVSMESLKEDSKVLKAILDYEK